ncbi:MAG: hypothetical protein ACKVZ0_07205 [Gemmatimonadales bacterium]
MNVGRIVKVAVAAGIVYNILDYIALNYVLASTLASMASIMKPEPSMIANMINNFAAGLMVAVMYEKVHGSFGAGAAGGATFGLFAGLLVNIPIWIGLNVYLQGLTYGIAWIFTIYGIAMYVAMGATAGAVASMGGSKAA